MKFKLLRWLIALLVFAGVAHFATASVETDWPSRQAFHATDIASLAAQIGARSGMEAWVDNNGTGVGARYTAMPSATFTVNSPHVFNGQGVQWADDYTLIIASGADNTADATAFGKGKVQLDNDLCGTAALPGVCGIHGGTVPSAPGSGEVGKLFGVSASNTYANQAPATWGLVTTTGATSITFGQNVTAPQISQATAAVGVNAQSMCIAAQDATQSSGNAAYGGDFWYGSGRAGPTSGNPSCNYEVTDAIAGVCASGVILSDTCGGTPSFKRFRTNEVLQVNVVTPETHIIAADLGFANKEGITGCRATTTSVGSFSCDITSVASSSGLDNNKSYTVQYLIQARGVGVYSSALILATWSKDSGTLTSYGGVAVSNVGGISFGFQTPNNDAMRLQITPSSTVSTQWSIKAITWEN